MKFCKSHYLPVWNSFGFFEKYLPLLVCFWKEVKRTFSQKFIIQLGDKNLLLTYIYIHSDSRVINGHCSVISKKISYIYINLKSDEHGEINTRNIYLPLHFLLATRHFCRKHQSICFLGPEKKLCVSSNETTMTFWLNWDTYYF